MSTLLEKPVRVSRIITTTTDQARAIEDPARAKVLEILYRKELSAEQILDELRKSGYKKALTTMRHHLDILKESGLIELVRIEEARGAITKFYGTSTKFLGFEMPKDFDAKYAPLVKTTSTKIEKLLKNISQKTANKNSKSSESDSYNQYLTFEIVNHAITDILENMHQGSK